MSIDLTRRAILVTDLIGFSALMEREGVLSAVEAVERMRVAATTAIRDAGGLLVKFVADNTFSVFPAVRQAIEAARTLGETHPIGAGIGFGEVYMPPGDLWGVEVNRAAKLGEDRAGAGGILLTDAAGASV